MSKTFYVTTPAYYVNDSPHVGHAYTTIACDTLARFWREQGRDVRFLTGTDEHGIKIFKAAGEKNISPKELADQVVVHFEDLWKELNISNDDFIRTTQPRHEKRVQEIVRRLVEADEIYLGQYEGWYDEGQEEFVTESEARENDYKGAISGKPLLRYGEPSYFFRLAKWVPKLIEYIEANPGFIQPDARRNEVLSKLAMGVEDLSVSRQKQKLGWGVEMPNDPDHVVYVWVDALTNYISSLGIPDIGDSDDGQYAKYWPADLHLIGKDILWFHAVYWPCMLMALDMPLPKCVFAHGWWTSEGKKMSKSLGNFISREVIEEICADYSADVLRFFLLRAITFGADGDFSHEMLRLRYNTELANGVGNLLSRTTNMIGRYFDGAVPPEGETISEAQPVLDAAAELYRLAPEKMEACRFGGYLDAISNVVSATNRFIEVTEPFKLAKDDSRRERLATILYTCAEAVRIILLYLQPVMPTAAAQGLAIIGWKADERLVSETGRWGDLRPGTATCKSDPLFPRKK